MPANLNKPFAESCCDGGATTESHSAQPCGCDSGAKWICERYPQCAYGRAQEYAKIVVERQMQTTPAYDIKPSNPKDIIGTNKLPLSLVPGTSLAYQALGHLEGNLKYGLVNWRESGVRCSIYIDALLRHTQKFLNGEWEDPKTHVPHLGSMLACIGIIVDAYECGKLIDDRPKQAPVGDVIDRLSSTVAHLREMFKDYNPRHYTHEHAPTETPGIDYERGMFETIRDRERY